MYVLCRIYYRIDNIYGLKNRVLKSSNSSRRFSGGPLTGLNFCKPIFHEIYEVTCHLKIELRFQAIFHLAFGAGKRKSMAGEAFAEVPQSQVSKYSRTHHSILLLLIL